MLQAAGGDVPGVLVAWLLPFQATFTARTWQHVLVLVMGAILVPGRRTVANHSASASGNLRLQQIADDLLQRMLLFRPVASTSSNAARIPASLSLRISSRISCVPCARLRRRS